MQPPMNKGVACVYDWQPGKKAMAVSAIKEIIRKTMDKAAAGPEGVECAPVCLAENYPFKVVLICKKEGEKCGGCKGDRMKMYLEARQTENTATVAQQLEDEAVEGLYELVYEAFGALKLKLE